MLERTSGYYRKTKRAAERALVRVAALSNKFRAHAAHIPELLARRRNDDIKVYRASLVEKRESRARAANELTPARDIRSGRFTPGLHARMSYLVPDPGTFLLRENLSREIKRE